MRSAGNVEFQNIKIVPIISFQTISRLLGKWEFE